MRLWVARIETALGAGYDEVLVSGRDERGVIQQVIDSPAFAGETIRSVTVRRIDSLEERQDEVRELKQAEADV